MSQRFFVEATIDGPCAELTGAEAQHLTRVMRASVGDEVIVFDGSGDEFRARIAEVGRHHVRLDQMVRQPCDRELPFGLVVGVALPKGDRQRWLAEKLTEIGVTRLVPLLTARGIVSPRENTAQRLERVVIESSKQCGRNRLMAISAPQSLHDFVQTASPAALRLFAHPPGTQADSGSGLSAGGGEHPGADSGHAGMPQRGPRDVVIAVGPEGGFTDEEAAFAGRAGWQMTSLGPRIFRVETAAIALAAAIALQ